MKRIMKFASIALMAPSAAIAESAIISGYPPANPNAATQEVATVSITVAQAAQPTAPSALDARATTELASAPADVTGNGTGAIIIVR